MESSPQYALSVKQPWAALIMQGLKTIEIRSWPTARRGRIYIHAGRIIDDRPQGWQLVGEQDKVAAQLTGGLVGTVEISDCLTYRTREEFLRDAPLHRNDPSWYDGSILYGFCLSKPEVTAFRALPGWFRFFTVDSRIKSTERKKTP